MFLLIILGYSYIVKPILSPYNVYKDPLYVNHRSILYIHFCIRNIVRLIFHSERINIISS